MFMLHLLLLLQVEWAVVVGTTLDGMCRHFHVQLQPELKRFTFADYSQWTDSCDWCKFFLVLY